MELAVCLGGVLGVTAWTILGDWGGIICNHFLLDRQHVFGVGLGPNAKSNHPTNKQRPCEKAANTRQATQPACQAKVKECLS